MPFYSDMQDMVRDLLVPDTEGGFGQGVVVLTRTSVFIDPDHDWEESGERTTSESETLSAAVSGAEEYADGDTILATDRRVVAAVPVMNWRPPESGESARLSLTLDGKPVTIVRIRGIPPVGTPAAIELIARG